MVQAHEQPITALVYDPSGTLLATASEDTFVKIWTHLATSPLFELHGHKGKVTAISWSSAGGSRAKKYLASCSVDTTI